MRKFNVTVNGESFEVEIEEVGENAVSVPNIPAASNPAPVPPKAAAPKAPAPKPAAPKPKAAGGANDVTCPLPGTVLNIVAKEGQNLNAGDVVMIIEAMKMENEIVAPNAGSLAAIHVKKGDSVQAGDLLFTLG